MLVETALDGAAAVVRPEGRLDAEGALDLADALELLAHAGTRAVVVDLGAVTYVSSVATRMLTRHARDFAIVRGELFVAAPPPALRDAFGAEGLADAILGDRVDGRRSRRISLALDLASRHTTEWRTAEPRGALGQHELFPREAGATLICRLHGPELTLDSALPLPASARDVSFPDGAFGLGLGALGSPEGARARMGELVAAGGAVVCHPTDGGRVPDHLARLGGHVATATLLSGISCHGRMSHLVRFRAARPAQPVPLSEIAGVCLDASGAECAGFVLVGEAASLVGATALASPAAVPLAGDGGLADLRARVRFTAGPAYDGTTAIVVAVVARRAPASLASRLRPIDPAGAIVGHCHAAVLTHHPVPQRTADIARVVELLLSRETVRAVMHLLLDDREPAAPRESAFARGLAWTAPIAVVEEAPS